MTLIDAAKRVYDRGSKILLAVAGTHHVLNSTVSSSAMVVCARARDCTAVELQAHVMSVQKEVK